jgi:hypothetical protein
MEGMSARLIVKASHRHEVLRKHGKQNWGKGLRNLEKLTYGSSLSTAGVAFTTRKKSMKVAKKKRG